MNYYIDVWKKFSDFSGRSRRAEFWIFTLVNIVAINVLAIVDGMIGMRSEQGVGALSGIYGLAAFIPFLAVAARRLHDTGKSAWFLLLYFLPCLGALILLVFYILDSTPGPNQYGPNPKGK